MNEVLKDTFKRACKAYITRDGIDSLLDALEKTDFYTCPASTRYHHSYEGGTVQHSLEVLEYLDEECGGQYSMETKAIVALFHDICKMGFYKTEMRNTKDASGKWVQVPYYTVDDKFPYGHGEKSVFLITEHMKLTTEEAMAIRWHMGGFEAKENYLPLGQAFEEFPLALYLHIADMKSNYLSKHEERNR